MMRIVKMNPQEEGTLSWLPQPLQSLIDHFIRGTFHEVQIALRKPAEVKVIVIKIKPMVQTKAPVQNCRRDPRTRVDPAPRPPLTRTPCRPRARGAPYPA